jgi:chemotaxis protein methyltransferase CheR
MSYSDIELNEPDFEVLSGLIYETSGICLGPSKRLMLANRLRRRVNSGEYGSIREYLDNLLSRPDREAVADLIDMATTHHTSFFRENGHFEFLAQVALPKLEAMAVGQPRPIRAWSAAASSGEEPYSLAMVLSQWESAGFRRSWSIIATDISRPILDEAKQGIYSESKMSPVPTHLKVKYFEQGIGSFAGRYRITADLRASVQFSRLNLLDLDYPITKLQDIIFCRNVMIYFDQPSREQVVKRLLRHLAPGGYLMIGHTENLLGITHGLRPVGQSVFQKSETDAVVAQWG